jgi:hypothetical protein
MSKVLNRVLFSGAVSLAAICAAQAADLPSKKAAPIEYVRICDAYGSGFFYIPGTETCLRVGGTVVGEYRSWSTSYRMSRGIMGSNAVAGFGTTGLFLPGLPFYGSVPGAGNYANARSGDNQGFSGTGRIELDARTATPLGALRTFIRLESTYGSDSSAATGSLGGGEYFGGFNFGNATVFRSTARETTILNKAFIQFAGLTAGRVQSFFDFYTDNINWEALRGSNATVGALAYTYTFGSGWSGTLSIEDNVSRRGFIGSTVAVNPWIPNANGFFFGPLFSAYGSREFGVPDGAHIPEIVGNVRYDQPWGAVQVSGAAHQIRTSLYGNNAVLATPTTAAGFGSGVGGNAYALPIRSQDDYGFAVQGGLQLNLDKIAPDVFAGGDKFWVQGVYEQGAVGYIQGNSLSFNGGPVNANTFYGYGNGGVKANNGWDFTAYDCIWTAGANGVGHCDKSWGWSILAALKHYWTPTLSSGVYGSWMSQYYSASSISPTPGAGNGVGMVNLDEYRLGSNLVWTPVKNFDIGGELMYLRDNYHSRPVGLAPDYALWAAGLPSWKGANSTVEGRLRVQRSF